MVRWYRTGETVLLAQTRVNIVRTRSATKEGYPRQKTREHLPYVLALLPMRAPVNSVDFRAPLENLAASLLHVFLALVRQVVFF